MPRRLWGLVTVGAATAVGVTTHDAGFVVITLIGTLALPRILGVRLSRHGWAGACGGRHAGRMSFEQRAAEWHRQSHASTPPPGDTAPVA